MMTKAEREYKEQIVKEIPSTLWSVIWTSVCFAICVGINIFGFYQNATNTLTFVMMDCVMFVSIIGAVIIIISNRKTKKRLQKELEEEKKYETKDQTD